MTTARPNIWQRARGRLAAEGPLRTLQRALGYWRRKLVCRKKITYMGIDLTAQEPIAVEPRLPVDFYWADAQQREWAVCQLDPERLANIRKQPALEDLLLLGSHQGDLAFMCYVGQQPPLPRALGPAPVQTVTIYRVYTFEQYRRQGIFSAACVYALAHLRALGVQFVWACALHDNLGSLGGMKRAGMVELGTEEYWEVLGHHLFAKWQRPGAAP